MQCISCVGYALHLGGLLQALVLGTMYKPHVEMPEYGSGE